MSEAEIDLQIGELILRGLPYGQRARIGAAIERELRRLLAEQGLPPALSTGGHIPQVAIGDLQPAPGAKPDAIGAQIAQRIYGSLAGTQTQAAGPVPNNKGAS